MTPLVDLPTTDAFDAARPVVLPAGGWAADIVIYYYVFCLIYLPLRSKDSEEQINNKINIHLNIFKAWSMPMEA